MSKNIIIVYVISNTYYLWVYQKIIILIGFVV